MLELQSRMWEVTGTFPKEASCMSLSFRMTAVFSFLFTLWFHKPNLFFFFSQLDTECVFLLTVELNNQIESNNAIWAIRSDNALWAMKKGIPFQEERHSRLLQQCFLYCCWSCTETFSSWCRWRNIFIHGSLLVGILRMW